jgi:hypothetical protein
MKKPKAASACAGFAARIVELTPAAARVAAGLAGLQQREGMRLKKKVVQQYLKLLDKNLEKLEAAADKARRAREPVDKPHGMAIHHARLTVCVTDLKLAMHALHSRGYRDLGALCALMRMLDSAATGSGIEHKKLRALVVHTNTPELRKTDLRAQAAALAWYCRRDKRKKARLYGAIEKAGMDMKEMPNVIRNALAGNLKDPTFTALLAQWKVKFAPLVAVGRDPASLFDFYGQAPADKDTHRPLVPD